MHLCFDWDGTLAKKEVAEEAAIRRGRTLGLVMDKAWMREAQKNHAHYQVNKQAISNYTGIKDEKLKTVMMTNLFQLHYLAVVHEMRNEIFINGILELLDSIKAHKLSIASTLRQDIIEPALEMLNMNQVFTCIKAESPDLSSNKQTIVAKVRDEAGPIDYMIGDREEDMTAGKAIGAKTIFISNGAGELKTRADHTVSSITEIKKILKN